MAQVIAGMTTSLDGFISDMDGSVAHLYPDFDELQGSDYMNGLIAETGAVLMGKGTFDMAGDPDYFVGNYEFQVPIFVVTKNPPAVPPKQDENLTFTFVTDGVAPAVKQATAAAGNRAVTVVGGPSLIQELLLAGLVDVLDIDVMPVFVGDGVRLFENPDLGRIRLEKITVQEIGARTNLRFRVVNDG